MQRALGLAIVAGVAGCLLGFPAEAGIWRWACRGQAGEQQQLIFDNGRLMFVDDNTAIGAIKTLDTGALANKIEAGVKAGTSFYLLEQGESLDDKTLVFAREGGKRKVVLTEKSSRLVSKRHRHLGGRDEDIRVLRKVYLVKREDQPERDIAMQCMDYQLSTCGGRCKRD